MTLPLDHPAILALAWTLLHFLWQGTLLGLAAKAGLWLLRRRTPQARYLMACAVMLAMVAVPVATFLLLLPSSTRPALDPGPVIATLSAPAGSTAAPLAWFRETSLAVRPLLPWAVAGWITGVALLSLRLFGGWLWLVRLRTRLAEPAGACWQLTVNGLARRMHLHRDVRIFRSFAVDTPMVLGWMKPLVLVPAAVLTGLAPQALEAVLAHELAHVRRHDYLVNLLQSAVEVLLFYHPAVWWLSAQVRQERELCCDDAAVSLCGDPVLYARALTALEGLRDQALPATRLAPAAQGGSLMNRIQRLIAPTLPPSPSRRVGLIAALAVTALGAGTALHLQDPPAKAEARSESADKKQTGITLVSREKDGRLQIRLKGDVKIRPDGKPGVALSDGASIELSETAKDQVRRFKASKDKGAETRSFTVNGQERPVDEAWLNATLEKVQAMEVKADAAREKARIAEGKAKDLADKARRIEVRVRTGKDGQETITEKIEVSPDGKDGVERKRVIIHGDPVVVEGLPGQVGKSVFVYKGKDPDGMKVEALPGGKAKVYVFKDGEAKELKIDVERIAREARDRARDLRIRMKDLHGLREGLVIPDHDFDFDFDFELPDVLGWETKDLGPEHAEKLKEVEKKVKEIEKRSRQRELEVLQREMERLQRRMERLQERMHEEGTPPPPPRPPKAPKAPSTAPSAPRPSAATPRPSVAPAAPAGRPAPATPAAAPVPAPPPPPAPPAPPPPPPGDAI